METIHPAGIAPSAPSLRPPSDPHSYGIELITVENTGGRARARARALIPILTATGVQARVPDAFEGGSTALCGGKRLRLVGRRTVLAELITHQIPALVEQMEADAAQATRTYGAWLRQQPETDHDPRWRPSLRRAFRADFLQSWGLAYALRIHAAIAGGVQARTERTHAAGLELARPNARQLAIQAVDALPAEPFHTAAAWRDDLCTTPDPAQTRPVPAAAQQDADTGAVMPTAGERPRQLDAEPARHEDLHHRGAAVGGPGLVNRPVPCDRARSLRDACDVRHPRRHRGHRPRRCESRPHPGLAQSARTCLRRETTSGYVSAPGKPPRWRPVQIRAAEAAGTLAAQLTTLTGPDRVAS